MLEQTCRTYEVPTVFAAWQSQPRSWTNRPNLSIWTSGPFACSPSFGIQTLGTMSMFKLDESSYMDILLASASPHLPRPDLYYCDNICTVSIPFNSFILKQATRQHDIWGLHLNARGGRTRYFMFKQLPFGLSSACHVFTKINRPLVKRWRAQGLRSFIYLDDGAILVQGQNHATIASELVRADVLASGFLINEKKSKFMPTKNLEWLGFCATPRQWLCRLARRSSQRF